MRGEPRVRGEAALGARDIPLMLIRQVGQGFEEAAEPLSQEVAAAKGGRVRADTRFGTEARRPSQDAPAVPAGDYMFVARRCAALCTLASISEMLRAQALRRTIK